jgi:hypothetical protein
MSPTSLHRVVVGVVVVRVRMRWSLPRDGRMTVDSTSPPPEWPAMTWKVTLTSGDVILIAADATFLDGDDQVFELATGARPPVLIEVARLPAILIRELMSTARNTP